MWIDLSENKKKDINIIKTNFFTLARDSAVNKAVPASSLSVTFDLDCSPAVTKNNLFQKWILEIQETFI
jgi:hypothetical protein